MGDWRQGRLNLPLKPAMAAGCDGAEQWCEGANNFFLGIARNPLKSPESDE